MFFIVSAKIKQLIEGCRRAASHRALVFCFMAACLALTLVVTAADLRLTLSLIHI